MEREPLLPCGASSTGSTREDAVGSEMRKIVVAVGLCSVFMIVELVGGYIAGSLAVMTDAAHLLSDMAGFLMSLIAMSVGRLPADASMTYGFARAEVIGALVSVIFIWALTLVLVVLAIYRLWHPERVHAPLMFLLGLIGLAVNIIMGSVLVCDCCVTFLRTLLTLNYFVPPGSWSLSRP